ncbi:hypothetical protein SAMN05444682_115160 [Parapedobacter indicus]|uniref:Uncharacterized protein n=1 Tax=Parapedobacter indicus TaxID=1477437 RepID=A0A1I3V2Q5_9SPHI|nr:hypothetical protein CLV26_11517 [Parapedobacter indicus]SFJ89420.1 hypothetical protein SAMN05444682_115160 [Parapedobacter indicus]
MTAKRVRYNFDHNDLDHLMSEVRNAAEIGESEIDYTALMKYGYDRETANALIHNATMYKQKVEKVITGQDGRCIAILKKPQ